MAQYMISFSLQMQEYPIAAKRRKGCSPLLRQSRHIGVRGNRYLRKTGYEVMQSYVMHKPANDPIFTFIEKKRGEGKCGKLAMVAGLNKFLRVYYGKVTELYRSLPQ